MDKRISLPQEVVSGVLQYLGTRPWAEVNPLIAAIQNNAAEIETEEPSQD